MASSSPANKPVVLVDATPLRSPSGNRGIGRYVHDLFVGLEAIRDEWSAQLDIVALTDLSRTGAPLYERDLAHAASSTVEKKDAVSQKQIRWRRRLFVERAARRIGASLLHETEAIGTPLRLSVPRVVTCYDLIPLRFRKQYIGSIAKYPSRWLTEWRRYSIAERVVCISDRSNQDVRALLKLPQSQVFTVRTGIDLAKWVALSREPQLPLSKVGLSEDRPFVVYVGGADFRKNLPGMVRAVAAARKHVDVDLVWAGKHSAKERDQVLQVARKEGIEDHVKLLGFVDDPMLSTLYQRAVAAIYTSRLEGFGLPVIEAISIGCPIITGAGSGADEVAGDFGFKVDPDDIAGCADIITRLVREPAYRERFSEGGRERAKEFTHLDMARGYLAHYLEMANKHVR